MEHRTTQSDEHGHDEHHGGNLKYYIVFGMLCLLTVGSYVIGNNETLKGEMPQVAWALMMAVSCGKALLVMLCFMHLYWEANWKYVLTIPASIMSIFLVYQVELQWYFQVFSLVSQLLFIAICRVLMHS